MKETIFTQTNNRGTAVLSRCLKACFLALVKAFSAVFALHFPELNNWSWVALSYLSALSLIAR